MYLCVGVTIRTVSLFNTQCSKSSRPANTLNWKDQIHNWVSSVDPHWALVSKIEFKKGRNKNPNYTLQSEDFVKCQVVCISCVLSAWGQHVFRLLIGKTSHCVSWPVVNPTRSLQQSRGQQANFKRVLQPHYFNRNSTYKQTIS